MQDRLGVTTVINMSGVDTKEVSRSAPALNAKCTCALNVQCTCFECAVRFAYNASHVLMVQALISCVLVVQGLRVQEREDVQRLG